MSFLMRRDSEEAGSTRNGGLAPPAGPATAPWSGKDILASLGAGLAGAVGVGLLLAVARLALDVGVARTTAFVVIGTDAYVCLAVAAWWFCLRRHRVGLEAMGFRNARLGPLVAMVPLSVGLLVLDGALTALASRLTGTVQNPQTQALAPRGVLTTANFLWLLLLIAVIAPVCEELLFRGMIYRWARTRQGTAVAVIATSSLFALAHVVPVLLVPLFVLGVALALVAERSASIYPAITLHALNNGIALLVIYASLRP